MNQKPTEKSEKDPHVFLFAKRKSTKKIIVAGLSMILFAALFFRYWFIKPDKLFLYFKQDELYVVIELLTGIGYAIAFAVGYSARIAVNYYFQQELHIEPKIFWFDQGSYKRPYIEISNMVNLDVIEVKLSFELAERKDEKENYASLILKHAENISLASIRARDKKLGNFLTYVEVPQKLLERWEKDGWDCNVMLVRATSVHPTTNFRAITDTVEFKGKTFACHLPVVLERSS